MQTISILLALCFLFYLLSKAADLAISNLQMIAKSLGIHVFFMGLILGIFTSLPEATLGINSILKNIPNISLGNLFGGVIVLLGLILPLSIILNRDIKTEKSWWDISLIAIGLVPAILLSLDGRIGRIDGIILVVFYLLILIKLYFRHRHSMEISLEINQEKNNVKSLFYLMIALTAIIVLSYVIVNLAEALLNVLPISQFTLGLLMFAIGTNLPELIVAIRSIKNHSREISMGNIIGSALTNTLLIGIFAIISPYNRSVDSSFIIMASSLTVILIIFFIAYRTGNKLTRMEGFILLAIFLAYIGAEIILAV